MPKKNQHQIVKANVTRLKEQLKNKLDSIDANTESSVYKGFLDSRLCIEMGMWRKGKAIARHIVKANVEVISYSKLSRETKRSDNALKRWHKIYLKHPDMNVYRKIAEEKAADWSNKFFDKIASNAKQIAEISDTKALKSICGRSNKLIDAVNDYVSEHGNKSVLTGELEELRRLLNRISRGEK